MKVRLAASILCLLPLVAAAARAADLPTIGLDEVHRGMKGYGLSVFAGSEPERFGVEVLGVMRNTNPDTSYILARLSGHDLEASGVIAGMSGSPVYLDGRLAGAVAFSWSFTKGAIAGITPIAGMRRLADLPREVPTAAPTGVELSSLVDGRLPADLLERGLAKLRPAFGSAGDGARGALQWSVSGFGDRSLDVLRRGLGEVAPVGADDGGDGDAAAAGLVPGASVSAVLVDGDLRLAATGTVTDRRGASLTAFGHPFLGLGPVNLPMAASEVVTVVSNQATSFKIANLGPRVGAFEQDRLLGIEGRLGAEAPMLPVRVKVDAQDGQEPHVFHMEVAALPQVSPVLVAVSMLGSLDAASYSSGRQGLDLTARFRLARYGEVGFSQSFDGDGAVSEAVTYLLGYVSFLVQNEFEGVDIEQVEVDVHQAVHPRTVSLVGAHAERTVLKPGDPVVVNLDLAPYRGELYRRSIRFRLPEDIPDGPYHLFVGDGSSIDTVRSTIEHREPVTFHQALEMLRGLHSKRQLAVLGVFASRGLSVAGEVMPRLPGSVQSLWSAASSGSSVPLRLAVAQEHVEPMDVPLEGAVRIDLEVRRREPVTANEDGAADASAEETGSSEPAEPKGGKVPPAASTGNAGEPKETS